MEKVLLTDRYEQGKTKVSSRPGVNQEDYRVNSKFRKVFLAKTFIE